ncbi:MAG: UDP-N-acetylmuramate dehydrogenase [Pseudomonadales bacterium]|nr:UDP-N-acetylmuramate dehydrogenase [Pseudomonadales bacterium]
MASDLIGQNTLGVSCLVERMHVLEPGLSPPAITTRLMALPAPHTYFGGGSNVVLRGHLDGTAVLLRSGTWRVIRESGAQVRVRVDAGFNWHQLVMETLDAGLAGLENLALIPGTAGAAPMQNIGAYGVELSDRLLAVEALDSRTGRLHRIETAECGFGYRTSRFRNEAHWLILGIELQLHRSAAVTLTYPELRDTLQADGMTSPDPREVATAVMRIRRGKLPDPATNGNVGSFFRNPVVAAAEADVLVGREPGLRRFPTDGEATVKLSAAQLIDRAGWRGREMFGVGVWDRQPLVLVNRGTRRGSDFLKLADAIRTDIESRYGVALTIEPAVLGYD